MKSRKAQRFLDGFWLVVIGSVIGYLMEGIWWCFTRGYWEGHSTLIHGVFCLVYGAGLVLIYGIGERCKGKSLLFQFLLFTLAGSMVEYLVSYLQELLFGSFSWDYSRSLFNLQGRVCLSMALLWGVLGLLFTRFALRWVAALLDRLHTRPASVIAIFLFAAMLCDGVFSFMAVYRWHQRMNSVPASNPAEAWLDQNWGNDIMQKAYPNMRFIEP